MIIANKFSKTVFSTDLNKATKGMFTLRYTLIILKARLQSFAHEQHLYLIIFLKIFAAVRL